MQITAKELFMHFKEKVEQNQWRSAPELNSGAPRGAPFVQFKRAVR